MDIRTESPADHAAVEALTREAFWNVYGPGCFEHWLVSVLRHAPAFVPELSLVAEEGGRIIGHAMHTKARILTDSGAEAEVLCLGPISVLPEAQRQGIGGRLIAEARERARALGYRAIALCGDPAYYGRHGFIPAETKGIRTADDRYAAALQVCELFEGALDGLGGRYEEDGAFALDEAAAEAFDRQFPPKEKLTGTPSQMRFLELVSQSRPASA